MLRSFFSGCDEELKPRLLGLETGAAAGTDWIEQAMVRFAEAYLSVRARDVRLYEACMRERVVEDEAKVVVAQCILGAFGLAYIVDVTNNRLWVRRLRHSDSLKAFNDWGQLFPSERSWRPDTY